MTGVSIVVTESVAGMVGMCMHVNIMLMMNHAESGPGESERTASLVKLIPALTR